MKKIMKIGLLCLSILLSLPENAAPSELFTFVTRRNREYLAKINPATGKATPFHRNTGAMHCPGLDYTPSQKTILFGVQEGVLKAFNVKTGIGRDVLRLNLPLTFPGFAISADGQIFGIDNEQEALFQVDSQSGKAEMTGKLVTGNGQPFPVKYSGMDFAPDGTLYLIESLTDALYTVDPKTAVVSPVGKSRGRIGFNIGKTDLAITSDGTIYASANVQREPVLFTLDPSTAKATPPKKMSLDGQGRIRPSALGWLP
jgi:hypothetical protein